MTDQQILQAIRRLLAADQKPSDCRPIDLLQIIRLLLQHSDEHDVRVSRGTLASELGCAESVVYESQQRLQQFGWLTVRKGKHKGRSNGFTVHLDKLPVGDLTRTVVSDPARLLAVQYGDMLKRADKKRRLMKGWQQRFEFTFELLLTKKCDGNEALLRSVVNFALQDPRYQKKALRGPHELRRCWSSLVANYRAQQSTAAVQPNEAETSEERERRIIREDKERRANSAP